MKIGITCYPTYGGSGVVAAELGLELAARGHQVHFISYARPIRLDVSATPGAAANIHYHEVEVTTYPLFTYPPYFRRGGIPIPSLGRTFHDFFCLFQQRSVRFTCPRLMDNNFFGDVSHRFHVECGVSPPTNIPIGFCYCCPAGRHPFRKSLYLWNCQCLQFNPSSRHFFDASPHRTLYQTTNDLGDGNACYQSTSLLAKFFRSRDVSFFCKASDCARIREHAPGELPPKHGLF
jgi:hypothetical protein